jgi:uncharacterized protein
VLVPELLWSGPADPSATLVLGHGAGAAMDSRWMDEVCTLLADRRVRTARFEFAYMAARRQGVRRPAPRAESVTDEYLAAVTAVAEEAGHPGRPLLIGGKSFGGRVASLVAGDLHASGAVSGLVCLGYPFHPPGRPEKLRTAHLLELAVPALIVQGERDPFGGRDEAPALGLPPSIEIVWAVDGDHELRPRTRVDGVLTGRTHRGALEAAADAVAGFARRLTSRG